MSAPAPSAKTPATAPAPFCMTEWTKKHAAPYAVPYYLTLFGLIGAATTGFLVVIVLLVLVATNFNALGFVE